MKQFVSVVALVVLVGCGRSDLPKLGTVTGTVTVDGQPQGDAIVTFTPVEEGRPSVGETGSDGTYSLQYLVDVEGAMVGQHVVTVELVQTAEQDDLPEGSEEAIMLPDAAYDGSIKKEVKSGSNEINIEL